MNQCHCIKKTPTKSLIHYYITALWTPVCFNPLMVIFREYSWYILGLKHLELHIVLKSGDLAIYEWIGRCSFDVVIFRLFPLRRGLTLNGVFVDFVQEGDRDKWVPVTTAWRVLRLRVEGSCEYIEYANEDCRQGVFLQLGVWARCWQTGFVAKYKHAPRTWTDVLVRPVLHGGSE